MIIHHKQIATVAVLSLGLAFVLCGSLAAQEAENTFLPDRCRYAAEVVSTWSSNIPGKLSNSAM